MIPHLHLSEQLVSLYITELLHVILIPQILIPQAHLIITASITIS